ncbi:phosphomannomutase/phosphoglucomutase [Candidatus Saccharibacteria bacterium CPR2]|nr:phosphomannomutase/phosphoglucomutase [Candidatus Saccharibacteria bacterium CPR2]
MIEKIFKAYDVRGKVGSELTKDVVEKIGRAFADFLPKNGAVAVGRDMRPDSAELSSAMIKGLVKQGREVWNIGQVTSDMIYFSVGKFKLAGGAMVTASHNPSEYNGIKVCREEAKPVGIESGLAEIRDKTLSESFDRVKKVGTQRKKEITEDWVEHILAFVNVSELKPYKIAIDAGNGMAGAIIPYLTKRVPFEIIPMYFELDGSFPNHIANPLEPENLKDLILRVKQDSCDLGIAFDGDGDRAVLIDENGHTLTGTEMTAILAKYFLSQHPGATVLHNAICGRAAVESIKENGGEPKRTKVGHSFIKADMRKYNAVFAGEHSGHYYFRDNYMADSGLIAAIVATAVLSRSGKKLSEIANEFRRYSQIPETNFEVKNKELVMDTVAKDFSTGNQDWLDGLTVNYSDYWINVRPSNTEPLLRLNVEAKNNEKLREIVEKASRVIESNAQTQGSYQMSKGSLTTVPKNGRKPL